MGSRDCPTTETRFVVQFLRSNAPTEQQREADHEAKIQAAKTFLANSHLVKSVVELRRAYRNAYNSVRRNLGKPLYDATFMEVTFQLDCTETTRFALPHLYMEWCANPPAECWVGRGGDLALFECDPDWSPRSTVELSAAVFGVLFQPVLFCPEITIKTKQNDYGTVDIQVSVRESHLPNQSYILFRYH